MRHPAALIGAVGAAFVGGCAGPPRAPVPEPAGTVAWIGAQHKAVHEGDSGGKVRLDDLGRRPHLYAVGPLAGLVGEITVLDGRATISTVQDGVFRTHESLDHSAAFLAWAYASEWSRTPLPESVRTLDDLEGFLPEAARAAGLDAGAPLVFQVEGRVESLKYHVLSPPDPGLPPAEAHEKAKTHASVGASVVRMVGFYSTEHRGEFTPGTSDVHVHFVSEDGRSAGHVEGFTLAPGAELLFPQR